MTEYLQQFSQQYPNLSELIQQINQDYEKKMWHNISDKLIQLTRSNEIQDGTVLKQFYENFISNFELKMNLIKLGKIVVEISSRYPENDAHQAYEFVKKIYDQVVKKNTEASCIFHSEMAYWKLKQSDFSECKNILDQVNETIQNTGYVDNFVNANYYRVFAQYLQAIDDPNEFYRNELLYLAYTPVEEISEREQKSIAFDLGIAALIGNNIYNFGEFLQHEVVESLKDTEANWLYELLLAYNRGDIQQYQNIMHQNSQEIESRPLLKNRKEFLHEKIQLMCVLELVFQKSSSERNISFQEISQKTGKPHEEVEPLLLKALAYDLIRGTIDGINETVYVKWAQPRILDRSQVASLRDKLGSWLEKVDKTIDFMKEHGTEDLTAS